MNLPLGSDFLVACAVGAAAVLLLACLASALPGARAPARRAVLRLGVAVALLVPGVEAGARAAGWGVLPRPTAGPARTTPSPTPARSLAAHPTPGAASAAPEAPAAVPAARPRTASPTEAAGRGGARPWLLAVWLAGVGVAAARLAASLRSAERLRRGLRPTHDERVLFAAADAARRLGLRRVPVLESEIVRSPVTVGLLRPVVALPAGFAASLSDDELRAVVAHEAAHVASRDPLATLAAKVLRALHWFDPLAHLAVRRLHATSEAVADLSAVAGDPAAPRRFAACLARLAAAGLERTGGAVACLGARAGALERRVAALLSPDAATVGTRLSRRGRDLVATTVLLAVGGLAVARPAPSAADEPAPAPARRDPDGHGVTLSYRGRVVGPDGAPVAGATVYVIHGPPPQVMVHGELLPWLGLAESPPLAPVGGSDLDRAERPTGEDGRFAVDGVEPPAGGFVVVVHPAFVPARVTAPAETARDRSLDVGDVRLARGGALHARVVGPDGAPAAGAWIVVQPEGMPYDRYSPGEIRSSRTDARGEAVVEGLREVPYVAGAFVPGKTTTVEQPFEVRGGAAHAAEFRLREAATLRVEVLDRSARVPLRGARVDVDPVPPEGERVVGFGAGPLARKIAEDGSVVFEGLDPGREYGVTAVPPDFAQDGVHHPPPFSVRATARAGDTEPVRLLLDPPVRLAVTVIGKGTRVEPLSRALVEGYAEWKEYDRTGGSPVDVRASTLETPGAPLVLDRIRAGPWRFLVWAPDHLPRLSDVVSVSSDAVPHFALEPAPGHAEGRVVASRDGAPVAGASVSSYEWIQRLGDGQRTKVVTDAAGAFHLAPLLGAGYPLRVEVQAPGFLPAVFQRPADERVPALGDLRLVRAATVRGRLVRDGGDPVVGVEVSLLPDDREPRTKDGGGVSATTDASGAFALPLVSPGRHSLHVPGRPRAPVDVPEGATMDLPPTTVR